MSSSMRRKRPELDRFGPIRGFGGVWGPPRDGTVPAENPPKGDTSSPSAVSRAVELGYSVIEEYIRQGQAFARGAGSQRGPEGPVAPDPRRLTERMYQYASDLAAVWLEYAQITTGQTSLRGTPPGSAPGARPAAPHVGGFDIGSDPAPAHPSGPPPSGAGAPERTSLEAPGVSIDIVSKRRAEVTVELKPGSAQAVLSAHDLRLRDPQLPRISGVTVDPKPSENRVVVRLEVPDDRPAGTYTGLIVDAVTNLPQGTLSLRVFE
jgi:hypothetical protein